MDQQEKFLADAEAKTFDAEHHRKILFNISQYDKKVIDGKKQYQNLELAKTRAAALKHKVTENLENYLTGFESIFKKRGGQVIWAQDGADAMKEIIRILKKADAKTVVKAKSMTTEEIHFNEGLEKEGI